MAEGRKRILIEAVVGLLVVASSVAAYVLAVTAGGETGDRKRNQIIVGAVLAGIPIVVGLLREVRNRRRIRAAKELAAEYEARFSVALGYVVTPLADLMGRIICAEGQEKNRLRGQLEGAVVKAAVDLCGPREQTRAVFFRLRGRVLRPEAWNGRSERPQSVFVDGEDRRGSAAHALVRGNELLLVEDVDADTRAPELRVRAGVPYKTFLAVAVTAGSRPLGMLAVDAVEAGSLEQGSAEAARALAQLLAVGLA